MYKIAYKLDSRAFVISGLAPLLAPSLPLPAHVTRDCLYDLLLASNGHKCSQQLTELA